MFTFSRLSPYERWDKFREEAKRLWDIYRSVFKPTMLRRLAVRYINRIDIPLKDRSVDLKHFLRTFPEVSPAMTQDITNCFMQLELPQDDLGAVLQLTEAVIPPVKPDTLSVVLDIDLYREQDTPCDEKEIWEFFERLRTRKNEIFEACITDRTRKLIL